MTLHDKNKPQRAARAQTLNLFAQESAAINVNVSDTVKGNELDLAMFVQTAKKRAQISKEKIASNVGYVQQSSKALAQSDAVQTEIDSAFENPFHDLTAFFSGDPSRGDLISKQRAITGKLNKINQDNVNTAALFDEQIAFVEQGLKDQLGLTDLRNDQSDQLGKLVALQSMKQVKRNEFENTALDTKTREELVAELIDPNRIFQKGLIQAKIREIDLENLDLNAKRRAALKEKELTKDKVLGFTGTQEIIQRANVMKAQGVDTGNIEGVRIILTDLEDTITSRLDARKKNSLAVTSINQEALLQSTLSNDLLNIAKEQDIERMSPKNAAQFKFAEIMNQKVTEIRGQIADKIKNNVPVKTQEFAVLTTVQNNAAFLSEKAVQDGAVEAAERFSGDEVAHASALKFYQTGQFNDSKDARNVFINLAQNETPSAIANESVVFGKTLEAFTKVLNDNLFAEFPDAPNEIDEKTGKAKLDLNALLASGKTRRINFANAWNKSVNMEVSKDEIAGGGEPNLWVSQMTNQMNSVQSEVATSVFLENEVVKLYPEFGEALTTPGGGLRLDFLNAPNGTMSAIANKVALIEQRLIEKGSLTDSTNIFAKVMESFQSEATISVVSREYNRSSIALKALLRPLYGIKQNYVESYMQTFKADVKNIGAQDFPQQARAVVQQQEQLRQEGIDEELQRGQSGLLGE